MGSKGRDRAAEVAAVRAVLGGAVSDMEAIRALHMSNGDVAAAINILLDAPLQPSPPPNPGPVRATTDCATAADCAADAGGDASRSSDSEEGVEEVVVEASEPGTSGGDWWLVGSCEVAGLSTCKGRRVKVGDQVVFGFPAERSGGKGSSRGKGFGRGRAAGSCSEIVRFSTAACGEIGRIPNEWARCLLPLVREKKIRVEGYCKSCPHLLGIMDNICLFVSVYIKGSMFRKRHHSMVKISRTLSEESTVHPLPTLLKLLGLKPIRKAEFTPEDFYTRKRPFDSKTRSSHPNVNPREM